MREATEGLQKKKNETGMVRKKERTFKLNFTVKT
jgi:hypothetical protein